MKKLLLIFMLLPVTILVFGQEIKYVNTEQLNVRAGAGSKYEVVDKISQGQKVTVLLNQGKWSEIELENGQKGFVSTSFLSDNQNSSSLKSGDSNSNASSEGNKSSWISFLVVIGLIFFSLYKIKNFFYNLFSSSPSSSGSQRTTPVKKQETKKSYSNSAVYKFKVKGSGSVGGVKYIDGMNIEVAISGLGSSGSPFNNIVEKLFVQEFARKYNIEPRLHSSIKGLFNRDRLDAEAL